MRSFKLPMILGIALSLSSSCIAGQANVKVVPMPKTIETLPSEPFIVTSQTVISFPQDFEDSATTLHKMFAQAGQFSLKIVPPDQPNSNRIRYIKTSFADLNTTEGYRITVKPTEVTITAAGPAGAFYATQTLRQLLPDYIEDTTAPRKGRWVIPAVTIRDEPALPWRGLMLDCARQYFTVAQIKKMLDAMALLKQNRFHWHLIDDNGWRLQSEKYPQLTDNASMRGPSAERRGGFYTKEEVRDIVAYAKARYIEVVPEFEMPAHSNACLVAMPELSCKGTPYKLPSPNEPTTEFNSIGWYNLHEPSRHFCAGNDEVFKFYNDIFDEAVELFPFGIWHIGGDERPAGIWSQCPKCQARMKELKITDEHDLQTWFMRKMSAIVAGKGKTPISWAVSRNEVYYDPKDVDNLGSGAILMNWHGAAKLACQLGIPVVNAATNETYLDYPPFEMYPGPALPDWMAILDLERFYNFNPIPEGLTQEQEKFIIGSQTCIWTGLLNPDMIFEWTFPRILGAAEAAWVAKKDREPYPYFKVRVDALEPRFAMMGIPYGHPVVGGNKGDGHRRY